MDARRVSAARLLTLTLAALLLGAAPSSRAGSLELRPTHETRPGMAPDVRIPHHEGLLSTAGSLTGEVYRGAERFRPLSGPAALASLSALLTGASALRSPTRPRKNRASTSPPRRVAGSRAPPLQLA